MKLGLAGRGEVPERLEVARRAVAHLDGRADLVASRSLAEPLGIPAVPIRDMDVDAMVTFGGDGTILYALQRTQAPILGVNLGEMGFLTATEPEDMEAALDRLLSGDHRIEEHPKLGVRLGGERLPDAANEVVVKTPRPSKILSLEVTTDGRHVAALQADGLIVATPTGCTGYSLSAGGPLVDPRLEVLLLVPLAPFRRMNRPLVLPMDETLEVHLVESGKDGILAIDGQVEHEVRPQDALEVFRSESTARFVRFRHDFYDRLENRFP